MYTPAYIIYMDSVAFVVSVYSNNSHCLVVSEVLCCLVAPFVQEGIALDFAETYCLRVLAAGGCLVS